MIRTSPSTVAGDCAAQITRCTIWSRLPQRNGPSTGARSRLVQWWCILILLAGGCGSQALDTTGQQEDMIAIYQAVFADTGFYGRSEAMHAETWG